MYVCVCCCAVVAVCQWGNYLKLNDTFAGTACHQESCYLQEIAQEVAMRERQHVWVDGRCGVAAVAAAGVSNDT